LRSLSSSNNTPSNPNAPLHQRKNPHSYIAVFLSIGLPFTICLIFDFLDPRICIRKEFAATIGGPGCKPIPALLPNGKEADSIPLNTDHNFFIPIRDLAIRLLLENQRANARVFSLVGAHPSARTTSLSIAISRG
ncbi:MAG: hypothetical protein NZL93_00565, partial [Chthoniobacterales bacterium]|nr:hypothetical protein [Chthoniobacterales bacterium]